MSSGTLCKAVAHKKNKKQFISKSLNSVFIVIILSLNSVLTFWNQSQMYHPYHAIPIQCLGWNMFEVKPRDWSLVLAYEGGFAHLIASTLGSRVSSSAVCPVISCIVITLAHLIQLLVEQKKQNYSVAYLRIEDPNGKVEIAFLAARSQVAQRKEQTIPHSPTGNGLHSTYRSTIS